MNPTRDLPSTCTVPRGCFDTFMIDGAHHRPPQRVGDEIDTVSDDHNK